MVSANPWPFLTGLSSFILVMGLISYMHNIFFGGISLFFGFVCISFSMFFWFRDIVREGTFMGLHSFQVQSGLRMGFLLFIVSEVMFFFAFFWAYFHVSVCPSVWIGGIWPPEGIVYFPVMLLNLDFIDNPIYNILTFDSEILINNPNNSNNFLIWPDNEEISITGEVECYTDFSFLEEEKELEEEGGLFFLTLTDPGVLSNPLGIPLLNTVILLSSGLVITFSHNSLRNKDYFNSILSLLVTIFLGFLFFIFQVYEYICSSFSINDGIYGTVFYMLTGFHGFHVFVGTVFLLVCLIRFVFQHFTPNNHFGLEAAIWYWHFVDVVWIFLFFFIYLWPNYNFFYNTDSFSADFSNNNVFFKCSINSLLDKEELSFYNYSNLEFDNIQEIVKKIKELLSKDKVYDGSNSSILESLKKKRLDDVTYISIITSSDI